MSCNGAIHRRLRPVYLPAYRRIIIIIDIIGEILLTAKWRKAWLINVGVSAHDGKLRRLVMSASARQHRRRRRMKWRSTSLTMKHVRRITREEIRNGGVARLI